MKTYLTKNIKLIGLLILAAKISWAGNVYLEIGKRFSDFEKNSQALTFRSVPKGNTNNTEIPEFPSFTKIYTRAFLSGNLQALLSNNPTQFALTIGRNRIPEIMNALKSQGLLAEVVRLARLYNIDPVHILGPIIGENSFNGAIDRTIQDSYAKMFKQKDFEIMDQRMKVLIDNPDIEDCLKSPIRNYWKWRCITFNSTAIANNSNRDWIFLYYQITGHGTFGLGQVEPFLLWSFNDLAHEKLGYPKIDIDDSRTSMKIIFNNKMMLGYIAAMVAHSIDLYKFVAQVDISQNPGLTTTLYNVGDEYQRAFYFSQTLKTDPDAVPQVNYMGWYVNYFEKEIRSFLR